MTDIIASMTTIPSRINLIRPAIESALDQTVPVKHIELNVPYRCIRTAQDYRIPAWLQCMEGVRIFRPDDYGPITKVAPTFLRHRGDRDTYIWSIDDDCAYPTNQLELLYLVHDSAKRRILTRHGGKIRPDGTVQFLYGETEVSLFEGFGSVLYPPDCIGNDFAEYLKVTSANRDCRMNDDMVLSLYFARHGLPIYLYNKPSDEVPFTNPGWLPHAKTDALSDGGYEDIYKRIISFVNSLTIKKQPPSG